MALDDPHFQAAPWTLRGEAIVGLKLVPAAIAQRLVPSDAKVLRVWPKRTLAVLYLAQYRQSPVGEYRELIIAPALVSRQGRVGFWISHIYVDNSTSLAAGRALWALPKQMASIQWTAERIACTGQQLKLQAAFASPRASIPLPFIGAAMSKYGSAESWFSIRGAASLKLARATVDLAGGAGLDEIGLGGSMRACFCGDMRVTIDRARKLK